MRFGRSAAMDAVVVASRKVSTKRMKDRVSRGDAETRGVGGAQRVRVYDRLASLVPPPAEATRDRVLAGDRRALDAWWNALGLDSASWWRIWKRKW